MLLDLHHRPVSDVRFTEHMNFFESIALQLCLENMKSVGERAKYLMQKKYGIDYTNVINLPASFDGSCCSRKWTAKRGIVSAVVEISSQVIYISYKYCGHLH